VYTYLDQDLDPERWELIVIDDNSPDDVRSALKPLDGKIKYQYFRLDHDYGMRGNTMSFNTAFALAKAPILAETTPECLLPHNALTELLKPHLEHERAFVALKVYNLLATTQIAIDSVDWRSDILSVRTLPGWDDIVTQRNVPVTHFKTHQICSIKRSTWDDLTRERGYPLFADYGSDDPWFAGTREKCGVLDITLPNDVMAIHQWHLPFQYWMTKGFGPRLNKWAHTMENYMQDTSGYVPEGGTCEIWDGGSHEGVTEGEAAQWAVWDPILAQTLT